MRKLTLTVAAALAVLVSACSSSTPPPAAPSDDPQTIQGQVLSDANGVANQLDQRYADMEDLLP